LEFRRVLFRSRSEKLQQRAQIGLLIAAWPERRADHDAFIGEIQRARHDGYAGIASDVVEAHFPALDPLARAFRRQDQDELGVLAETLHGLLDHITRAATVNRDAAPALQQPGKRP